MNLHEYQGKQLFAAYGLPVSKGIAVDTPEAAVEAAKQIGGDKWVVKAQVHAGGRGKAGGVKLVDSPEEAKASSTTRRQVSNSVLVRATLRRPRPTLDLG